MGNINYSRVLIGGIVAGLIFLGLDVLGFMLMNMDMEAWLTQHALHEPPMWVFYLSDILFGIIAVWLYAAIRPRFGPGWKTAVIAGVFMWVCFTLAYFSFHMMGLFTQGDYMMTAGWWLVAVLVATPVGAFLYKENDGAAARM